MEEKDGKINTSFILDCISSTTDFATHWIYPDIGQRIGQQQMMICNQSQRPVFALLIQQYNTALRIRPDHLERGEKRKIVAPRCKYRLDLSYSW